MAPLHFLKTLNLNYEKNTRTRVPFDCIFYVSATFAHVMVNEVMY